MHPERLSQKTVGSLREGTNRAAVLRVPFAFSASSAVKQFRSSEDARRDYESARNDEQESGVAREFPTHPFSTRTPELLSPSTHAAE
jgi:hypothetical protein